MTNKHIEISSRLKKTLGLFAVVPVSMISVSGMAQTNVHIRKEKVSPIAVSPRKLGPRVVSPRAVSPRKVDPRVVSPRAVSPRKVDPRVVGPRKVSPRAIIPKEKTPGIISNPVPASKLGKRKAPLPSGQNNITVKPRVKKTKKESKE